MKKKDILARLDDIEDELAGIREALKPKRRKKKTDDPPADGFKWRTVRHPSTEVKKI